MESLRSRRSVRARRGWRLQQAAAPVDVALRPRPPGTPPTPSRSRGRARPDAAGRWVDLPAGRSVLILGEAGFGKTTVALRRLLRLRREAGPSFRAAIVVPTEGLFRLTEVLLERMGVRASIVKVWHYDTWVAAQARRAFRDCPRRRPAPRPPRSFASSATPRSAPRWLRWPPTRPSFSTRRLTISRRGALVHRGDLEHLFGDRLLLERVVATATDSLRPGDVGEVLAHTRAQFRLPPPPRSSRWSSPTGGRSTALDGREGSSEGTPDEIAGALDTEDLAPLFEARSAPRRARRGGKPATLPRYDFAWSSTRRRRNWRPSSWRSSAAASSPAARSSWRATRSRQVDPAAGFGGWPQTLAELGRADPRRLRAFDMETTAARPKVTALARPLRAPVGHGRGAGTRDSLDPPGRALLPLLMTLSEALREAPRPGIPTATVAVIARAAPRGHSRPGAPAPPRALVSASRWRAASTSARAWS